MIWQKLFSRHDRSAAGIARRASFDVGSAHYDLLLEETDAAGIDPRFALAATLIDRHQQYRRLWRFLNEHWRDRIPARAIVVLPGPFRECHTLFIARFGHLHIKYELLAARDVDWLPLGHIAVPSFDGRLEDVLEPLARRIVKMAQIAQEKAVRLPPVDASLDQLRAIVSAVDHAFAFSFAIDGRQWNASKCGATLDQWRDFFLMTGDANKLNASVTHAINFICLHASDSDTDDRVSQARDYFKRAELEFPDRIVFLDDLACVRQKDFDDWRNEDRWDIRETVARWIPEDQWDELFTSFRERDGQMPMSELFAKVKQAVRAPSQLQSSYVVFARGPA